LEFQGLLFASVNAGNFLTQKAGQN